MNHIQAFYSIPHTKTESPSNLYSATVFALLPVSFLCRVHSIHMKDKKICEISSLKPQLTFSEKIITIGIAILLFIPSIILGTCLRLLTYTQKEVRDYHSQIVEFKSQNSAGVALKSL